MLTQKLMIIVLLQLSVLCGCTKVYYEKCLDQNKPTISDNEYFPTQRDRLKCLMLEELNSWGEVVVLKDETHYMRDNDSTRVYKIGIDVFPFKGGVAGDSVYYVIFDIDDSDDDSENEPDNEFDSLSPFGIEIVIPYDPDKEMHPKYIPPYDFNYEFITDSAEIAKLGIKPCHKEDLIGNDKIITEKFTNAVNALWYPEPADLIDDVCLKFVDLQGEIGKNCDDGAFYSASTNTIYLDTVNTSFAEWRSDWGFAFLVGKMASYVLYD